MDYWICCEFLNRIINHAEIACILLTTSGRGLKTSSHKGFVGFYWYNLNPSTLACATHVGILQDIGHNPSPLEGEGRISWRQRSLEIRVRGITSQPSNARMNGNRHAEFISASYQPSASISYWQGPETRLALNGYAYAFILCSACSGRQFINNKKKPHKVASFNGGVDNARFELAKTQAGIKKEPTKEALNFNGGADTYRFKLLVVSYMKYLLTPNAYRICSLIEKLGLIV